MTSDHKFFRLALPRAESASVDAPLLSTDLGESPDDLLRRASRFMVLPAVYQNLRACVGDDSISKTWHDRARKQVLRNLVVEGVQSQLLTALRNEGIRCIPVKGVELTRLLYPGLSWRQIRDIDLVFPPEDLTRAYACLKDFGLTDDHNPWGPPALTRLARRPAYLYPELHLHAPQEILIELHWNWTTASFPAKLPSDDREAYLVYLCRNAGKRHWTGLWSVVDIEAFVRKFGGALDWDRFWKIARQAGLEKPCSASLQVCGSLFATPRAYPPITRARSAGRRLAQISEEALLERREPLYFRSTQLRLLAIDSAKHRLLRCLSYLAPPPRHWTHRPGEEISTPEVWLARYRRLLLRGLAAVCPLPSPKRRLLKMAEFSSSQWWLALRVWWVLGLVKIALQVGDFKNIRNWAARVRETTPLSPEQAITLVDQTVLLVETIAARHLTKITCLPRALTITRLLGRRGIRTDLKMGLRKEADTVKGHAWVEYERRPINDPDDISTVYPHLVQKLIEGELS